MIAVESKVTLSETAVSTVNGRQRIVLSKRNTA